MNNIANRCRYALERLLLCFVRLRHIRHNQRISFIMSQNLDSSQDQWTGGERDWPGNPDLRIGGWSDVMLLRYALAMHYGIGKTVMDSCCGLGWGTYLLDGVAARTVGVDSNEQALKLARNAWPTRNTEFINASVLEVPFAPETFDLIAAMETIEHFPSNLIDVYLIEAARVLKPGGILVGSSTFPETREEAESIRARNPHHMHICTRQEISRRLQNCGYKNIHIFFNRLFFFAMKPKGGY